MNEQPCSRVVWNRCPIVKLTVLAVSIIALVTAGVVYYQFDYWKIKSKDARTRMEAIRNLSKRGSRPISHLTRALQDEDRDVREAAVRALVTMGDAGVDSLAVAFNESSDNAWISGFLISELSDDTLEWRRTTSSAIALGVIGETRAIEPLISLLLDQRHYNLIREAACKALGLIGASAIPPLIAAIERDEYYGDPTALVSTVFSNIGPEAVARLISAAESENALVREAAIRSLGSIGDRQAVGPLIAALEEEAHGIRQCAVDSLGAIGDERAVEPLIVRLKDENARVRASAAKVLGRFSARDVATAEKLSDIIRNHEDPRTRALWSFFTANSAENGIRDVAANMLDDPDCRVRWYTLWALASSRSYRDNLLRYVEESSAFSPEWGKWASAQIKQGRFWQRDYIPYNVSVIAWDSGVERARAIMDMRDEPTCIPLLVECFKDTSPLTFREADSGDYVSSTTPAEEAAQKLAEMADTSMRPLLFCLADADQYIRQHAATALGHIGSDQATKALIPLLKDDVESVRASAAGALGKIGDRRAIEPLREMTNDHSPAMRDSAENALIDISWKGKGR
ncbi:MAG: HEAT repeat domain-containing protein [Sedimentisphaerales bacterium]|nr:HEAT repeat domain-containing protein [Sedimentisphaerales bacterium]